MNRKLLILLCIIFAIPMAAQVKNYVGTWTELSENSMLTNISGTDVGIQDKRLVSEGVGTAVGGGYELHAGCFLLNVGLQFAVAHTAFSLPDMQKAISNVRDDEGDQLNYIYHQFNRRDSYTNLALQLPVLIGAQVRNFYFLAGAKIGVSIYGANHIRTNISSSGDYEKFIDEFVDMPEHLFYDGMSFTKSARTTFQPAVKPHFEIGYVFGSFYSQKGFDVPKQKNLYRIAVFFDYGVLNMVKNGTNPILTVPEAFDSEDINAKVDFHDLLSSDIRQGNVNDFNVGIKFTALFPLKEQKSCVVCR